MSLTAHILVYDDEAITGRALGADLSGSGYINVRVANHFRPALEALEEKVAIDLLLADIRVPGGLNGIALARMARLRNPEIKVILLTGTLSGRLRKKLLMTGRSSRGQSRSSSFLPRSSERWIGLAPEGFSSIRASFYRQSL